MSLYGKYCEAARLKLHDIKGRFISKVNRGNFVCGAIPYPQVPVPQCELSRSRPVPAVYLVAIGSYVGHLETQRLRALCSRNNEETKLPLFTLYTCRRIP